jgi:hypothetical protein
VLEGRHDSDVGSGAITLSTARKWAMQVRDMCREEKDPSRTVAYMKAGLDGVKVHEAHVARAKEPASITWDAAKELFLDEVLRTRRKDTQRDYRIKLGAAELTERFAGRLVSQITDVEAAAAYAKIFGRAEPMGDGCLRVMKRFWNWMGDASRVGVTGVTINLPRTLSEDGDPNRRFDPKRDLQKKSPPEIELGRALAIARSGALPDWAGYGLQLLLASAQRRRQVIGANRYRFKDYEETPNEVAWFIPAFWRKTRKEGTERAHLVPVMGWGAFEDGRSTTFSPRMSTLPCLSTLSCWPLSRTSLFLATKRHCRPRYKAQIAILCGVRLDGQHGTAAPAGPSSRPGKAIFSR